MAFDPSVLPSFESLAHSDESYSNPSNLQLHRSGRVAKPSVLVHDFFCYSTIVSLYEPQTYRKASIDPLWQKAMVEENQALISTHTWDLVNLPPDKYVVGCKRVYKIKTWVNGSIEKYKVRPVAKGFT